MAYDIGITVDMRARIGSRPDLTEREMFGGIAFMIGGNMAIGVAGDELMVRVGKEAHDEAEAQPGARLRLSRRDRGGVGSPWPPRGSPPTPRCTAGSIRASPT